MNADTETVKFEILQWLSKHDATPALYSRGFFSEVSGSYPCSEREFVAAIQELCSEGLILCRSGLGNLLKPRDAVLAVTVLTVTVAGRNLLRTYGE